MPIYDALRKYIDIAPAAFHMPGHKMGKGLPGELKKDLLALDLTEIPGTDNLHYPKEAIKEAMQLAAKAFGADSTYFLVNGSTGGIHAAIMSVCKRGDRLIVARDCHKSVIGGMLLAGAEPVFIEPSFNTDFQILGPVTPEQVQKAISENSDAVGVFLTRPSYYGVCCDIEKIAEVVHKAGKILIVDEAHGAHLAFNHKLPVPSIKAGADICIQSAHKTLPCVTQGAYLHTKGSLVDAEKLEFMMRLLQTTSPSYIIMTFLDAARAIMQKDGQKLLDELLENISAFCGEVASKSSFRIFKSDDPTRLVINTGDVPITGFEMDKVLRERFGIQVEMADLWNVVCICTVADSKDTFDKLGEAVVKISRELSGKSIEKHRFERIPWATEKVLSISGATNLKGEYMSLEDAVGRVSLEMIVPYPPGIPLICPGEVVSLEAAEYMRRIESGDGSLTLFLEK